MKKIVLAFFVLFMSAASYANGLAIIDGTWKRGNPETIKLFKVEDGMLQEIASSRLSDGKFYFAFAPQREGFFVLGFSPVSKMNNYVFYFKPGDRLNVEIEPDSYKLVGENTPENKEMTKWHDFILPIEERSVYSGKINSTYVDFFPLLDEKLEQLKDYKQSYTDNQSFNKAFGYFRNFDMLNNALYFLVTPRSAHPQGEDFNDYYNNINISEITATGDLLDYPYGMGIMQQYQIAWPLIKASSYTEEQKKNARSLETFLPQIGNDVIKGEIVLQQTRGIKTYEGLLDFANKYEKYLVTDSQKSRFKVITNALAAKATGQEAVGFKFPDMTGKEIALSDFKNKVVYIDVWATWCGPCKKEIPFLKELEKKYHEKDVVFISVSVDDPKDIQKWKDYVTKEELKGVQVFAGDKKADIMGPYNIKAIPRFILVGKDGKLISADAPRPSSPEIGTALDAALTKK